MKNKLLKASLIAALVSSISFTAGAATLVDVEGSVNINRAGEIVSASNNMEVQQGDIIAVLEGSARLSMCSDKIEKNQAVQISDTKACPVAKELTSFVTTEKVDLAAEELAALFGVSTKVAIGILIALGATAAIALISSSNDDDPASP